MLLYKGTNLEEKVMVSTLRNLRVTIQVKAQEKTIPLQAADLQGVSLSKFMLSASLTAANHVLGTPTRFALTKKQIAALNAALDAPPRELPQIKALFARPRVFKK